MPNHTGDHHGHPDTPSGHHEESGIAVTGHEHEGVVLVPPPLAPGDPGPEIRERLQPPLHAVYLSDTPARVGLDAAENPSPGGSFGYVGRFLEVAAAAKGRFPRGTLVVGVDRQKLGDVGPETLRVFRWEEKGRGWELVARSRPGQTRDYVWALLTRPGLYGVIGLPRDPLVGRTLALLSTLRGTLAAAGRHGRRALLRGVCDLFLGSSELQKLLEDPRFRRAFVEENLRLGLPAPYLPELATDGRWNEAREVCIGLAARTPDSPELPHPPEVAMLSLAIAAPSAAGAWEVHPTVPPPADVVLAVHAALLATDRVLFFGGSENVGAQNLGAPPGIDNTRLFAPGTGSIATVGSPSYTDLFCAGHAMLSDGRLLAAGGTKEWGGSAHPVHGPNFSGLRDAAVFDPAAPPGENPWTLVARLLPERTQTLGGGSWYPTLVTLPDGRVLKVAGYPEFTDTRQNNKTLETFDPATGEWTDEGPGADLPIMDSPNPLYPRLILLPDGRVFCATPIQGPPAGPPGVSWIWNPTTRAWSSLSSGPGPGYGGLDSSCVLLPLRPEESYRARVLATNRPQAKLIDFSVASPVWQPTAPRALSDPITGPPTRFHATAVLLADGKVLVLGGHDDPLSWDPPVLAAELFDPATDTWSVVANAAVPRVYHSVALLLPDGRVWTGGSDYGAAGHEGRMELYSPPYLFAGPRPTISSSPLVVTLPETFEIGTPDAAEIRTVALARCGSSTHAFNGDQRWIGLSIASHTGSSVTVVSPPDARVAQPGQYLLFLLNEAGVPSVGKFVRIQSSNAPTIALLRPSSGPAAGGTAVTLSGTNFIAGAAVTVGGAPGGAVAVADETRITFSAPALPAGTLHPVVASNPGGASVTRAKAWLADFLDVPAAHPLHDFVASVFRAGITAGCGGGNFCPGQPITRAQMAVFLLKTTHGPGWTPPAATGAVFADVPAGAFAAAWIERLAAEGITSGCGGGNFCPSDPVTRGQMSVFLLRAENGPGYLPPPAVGLFADVPAASPFARFIERLAARKITAGCGGGNFCPGDPVTRGQMAAFLVKTFHLP